MNARPFRTTAWLLATLVAGFAVPSADAEPRTRRNVEIEWDTVEGASAYDVRVTRRDGSGKPLTFKLKSARWSANVKAGLYLMQLRAYDDRGVPGEWSPPSELVVKLPAVIVTQPAPQATIPARDADAETVRLAWEEIPGARTYRVSVTTDEGTETKDTETQDTKEPKADFKLKVARSYRWNVIGIDEKGQEGEVSAEPYAFALDGPALVAPRLERPLSKFVERIDWSSVPHADRYATELKIFNRARRGWDPVEGPDEVSAPTYELSPSRAKGRYALKVRALGAHRAPSPASTIVFNAAGGFSDQSTMRDARLRESLRPAGRHRASAEYVVGPSDYVARYAEMNSLARLSGAVNVLRLNVTRPGERQPWGVAAASDVGTFAIQGRAFIFGSLEARALYRLEPGRHGVLTLDAGLFNRQLPVVMGSPTDGFLKVDRVNVYGPAAGLSYAHPLTERWSARAEARAYYGLGGGLSHELGAGAAYRFGPRLILGCGLNRRHDDARFKAKTGATSFAKPGEMDQVTMDSLTLTLSLTLGF